jgi:hypothetical protein
MKHRGKGGLKSSGMSGAGAPKKQGKLKLKGDPHHKGGHFKAMSKRKSI